MKARILLVVSVVCIAGCGTPTILGPVPSEPEHTISVTIDSIPTGANVYAIDKDGQIGAKLGTTPMVHKCGIAGRYRIHRDTKARVSKAEYYAWGAGTQWKMAKRPNGLQYNGLFLNVALAKDDHSIGVGSKELTLMLDKNTDTHLALTIPLKSLEQVNRELEIYLQQQALNRQQNINIQYQKDGLDSVNSGLDALIKLQGLGALR